MWLVSFKNIHIWPSYGLKIARMPIFGHTFLVISEPFRPIWQNIFYGNRTQENIAIASKKSKLLFFIFTFDFLGHFLREMGVATTRAPDGWSPLWSLVRSLKTRPKIWPANRCFRNFQVWPLTPPLPHTGYSVQASEFRQNICIWLQAYWYWYILLLIIHQSQFCVLVCLGRLFWW